MTNESSPLLGSDGLSRYKFVKRTALWDRDEDGGPGREGVVKELVGNLDVSKDVMLKNTQDKAKLQYVVVAWDRQPERLCWYRYPQVGQMDLRLAEPTGQASAPEAIHEGSKVVRGPDWTADEDGKGENVNGRYGVVVAEKPTECQVLWLDSPETGRRWYKTGANAEVEEVKLGQSTLSEIAAKFCQGKVMPSDKTPEDFFAESLEMYQKGQDAKFKYVRQADGLYDVPYRAVAKRLAWTLTITMIPTFICLMVHASLAVKRDVGRGHRAANFNSTPLWIAGLISAIIEGTYVAVKLRVASNKERAARTAANAELGQGAKVRSMRAPVGVRGLHFVLSVALAGLLPVFVMNSSMMWWSAAVDAHGYCAHRCYQAADSDNHELNRFYEDACLRGGMNKTIVAMYKEYTADKLSWEGLDECERILTTRGHSNYTEMCLDHGWTLLAFETLMRSESTVSVVEIYWSMPMALCLVVWKCMSLSLHKKNKDLAQAIQVFLKQNIMNDPEQIWRYYENFLFLHQLHTGNVHVDPTKTSDFVLRLLHNIREEMMHNKLLMTKVDNNHSEGVREQNLALKKLVNSELDRIHDSNADGQVDNRSKRYRGLRCLAAFKEQVWGVDCNALKFAVMCTLVHLATPSAYRLWRTSFRESHEYWQIIFPNEQAIFPLAMNMVVCSIAYLVIYYSAWVAAMNYQGKYSLLLSFECMWSFPDESPLDLAEYNSGKGLMKMVAEKVMEARKKRHHKEDNYPLVRAFHEDYTQVRTEEGNLYRLDFSEMRDYEKLVYNVSNVNNWFQLRRYLQIEAIDDRVAVEMWSLLLLLAASFSICVMIWNIWFAGLKRNRGAQQVMNVHCLIQFGFVSLVLAFSMSVTLSFNTRFQNHSAQLQKLRDFMQSEYVKHTARNSKGADSDHKDRIDTLLGCLCKNMELFDKPATMFGFQINRAVVGRFTTLGLTLATTQLYPIIMNIVSGEIDDDDQKKED